MRKGRRQGEGEREGDSLLSLWFFIIVFLNVCSRINFCIFFLNFMIRFANIREELLYLYLYVLHSRLAGGVWYLLTIRGSYLLFTSFICILLDLECSS